MLYWDGKYEILELNTKEPAFSVPISPGDLKNGSFASFAEIVDARPTYIWLKGTLP